MLLCYQVITGPFYRYQLLWSSTEHDFMASDGLSGAPFLKLGELQAAVIQLGSHPEIVRAGDELGNRLVLGPAHTVHT